MPVRMAPAVVTRFDPRAGPAVLNSPTVPGGGGHRVEPPGDAGGRGPAPARP